MIPPRGPDGAETHGAAMTATSNITVDAARSRRRRRSRETSMSRASRSAWSYRTSRPPPCSSGSARGAERPASTVAESSFGAAIVPDRTFLTAKSCELTAMGMFWPHAESRRTGTGLRRIPWVGPSPARAEMSRGLTNTQWVA